MVGIGGRSVYVGDQATREQELLALKYPVQRGIVTDWDDYESLLQYIYGELRLAPDEQPLLVEAGVTPIQDRIKRAKMLFEVCSLPLPSLPSPSFSIPLHSSPFFSIPLHPSPSLNPPYLSIPIKSPSNENPSWPSSPPLLSPASWSASGPPSPRSRGYTPGPWSPPPSCPPTWEDKTSTNDKETARIKEGACYVARDYEEEEVRQALVQNIILCGGSTKFKGFQERFEEEVRNFFPGSKVEVTDEDRETAAWRGAARLAGLEGCHWMTKEEYEEVGRLWLSRNFYKS
jgi:actin-related protein